MEYGLGRLQVMQKRVAARRLNPCFNGIWSRTPAGKLLPSTEKVLILVLMEYGLGHERDQAENLHL